MDDYKNPRAGKTYISPRLNRPLAKVAKRFNIRNTSTTG